MTNPFHIGVAAIGASPAKLSSILSTSTAPTKVRTLILSNPGSNPIYIGGSAISKSTYADVVFPIPAGEFRTIGGFKNLDDLDWGSFYLDGTNGDVLIVGGQTVG